MTFKFPKQPFTFISDEIDVTQIGRTNLLVAKPNQKLMLVSAGFIAIDITNATVPGVFSLD